MGLDLLIPRFLLRQLPSLLAIAALGAILASLYGILHDQLTYTISQEYFTKLKFQQFAWANLGWPRRMFVAEIGLLASWWVGLIGGWLVARAGAAELAPSTRWPLVTRSFALVAITTLTAGLIGWLWGSAVVSSSSLSAWQIARLSLGVRNLPSFVIVAHIHNGTYLGAALGIVAAILYIRRARRSVLLVAMRDDHRKSATRPACSKCWSVVSASVSRSSLMMQKLTQSVNDQA